MQSAESLKRRIEMEERRNAFNSESRLIFIELIEHDIDLVTLSSIKKVVLFKYLVNT